MFRFDNIRLELDDVNECFELIKNLVLDSPAEPYFLSILQHLVCIRDDAQIRLICPPPPPRSMDQFKFFLFRKTSLEYKKLNADGFY